MALTLEQLQGSFGDPLSLSNTVAAAPSVVNYPSTSSPTPQVLSAQTSSSPTNADWQTVWNNGYNNNGNYGVGGDWLTQAYQAGQAAFNANKAKTSGTGGNQIVGQQIPTGDNGQAALDAANLASLNTGYDYYQAKGEEQIPYLSGQRDAGVQSINDILGQAQTSADSAKLAAEQNNQNETNKSLSTAQDVTKGNRNILRALGILDSTAAGEALQKPMNEFAKQRFQLGQALTTRLNDIQTFLDQKQTEAATAVKSLQDNYAQLIGQIKTDLRFNGRQRADAITQATAAAKTRMEEIATNAANIKSGADTAIQNMKASIFQDLYAANPTSDPAKIEQMRLTAESVFSAMTGKQVGIAQGETDMYGNPLKKQTAPTALSQYSQNASALGQPNILSGVFQQNQLY